MNEYRIMENLYIFLNENGHIVFEKLQEIANSSSKIGIH